MRKPNPYMERARELCTAAGVDPDSRVAHATVTGRTQPAWCDFVAAAKLEAAQAVEPAGQPPQYQGAALQVVGEHDPLTIAQMMTCMRTGNVVGGVLCADGHLGYAQPVGGVIALENQISISGVGFDIGCGNTAVRLDLKVQDILPHVDTIADDIQANVAFGIGRTNKTPVQHALFDDDAAWADSGLEDLRTKARNQLGTVGGGNHYVDLFADEQGHVWIGVHFGSRGLGHTAATRYLKKAGGRDGIHVAPSLVDTGSDLGQRYLVAMELAGRYAFVGRSLVIEQVQKILGATVIDRVNNHHNYAWLEEHDGRKLFIVRKGATPCFPGQRGFVGGSMADISVILQGKDTPLAKTLWYSTVHGAGRVFGRKEAKRRFTRAEMLQALTDAGVTLRGGDLDESPMAYRRLSDVLEYHSKTMQIEHVLRPIVVVMASADTVDPWKD